MQGMLARLYDAHIEHEPDEFLISERRDLERVGRGPALLVIDLLVQRLMLLAELVEMRVETHIRPPVRG